MTRKSSYAPVLMALGLTCTLWGAVTTWLVSAAGLIVVAFAGLRWLNESRGEPRPAAAPIQDQRVSRATVRPGAARRSEPDMANPSLHRYAILVAVFTFALVITGALVTSYSERPPAYLQPLHLAIASAVGLLVLGLALWLRGPAWFLLAGIVLEALLALGRGPAIGALHALLAQLIFAGAVAISVITSESWDRPSESLEDSRRLSFRKLSLVTLSLLVLQVALGAAYRHNAMGVLPHIIGALVVTIVILLLAVLVTNQYPEHAVLRPTAKLLIGITFTQVMLGMGAFITRLMMAQGTLPVVIVGLIHVANGSLTLATTTALTLLLRRFLRP